MSWNALQRIVADPFGAAVTGARAVGGALLRIEVQFRTVEWPWGEYGAVSLIPQATLVTAHTACGTIVLGVGTPNAQHVVTPMKHSSTASVEYALTMSTAGLAHLEELRDGGDLELELPLVAHPILAAEHTDTPVYPTTIPYKVKVPKEEWLTALSAGGFCETLVTELALPTAGPESTAAGRQRLAHAVSARNNGSYGETMRVSRIALNELENAGFGGKAPKDVVTFLKEKAGSLTQTERYSALKIALELYLHPAAHANAPEEHYTRADADLAIAMTAVLLRLAAVRGGSEDGQE